MKPTARATSSRSDHELELHDRPPQVLPVHALEPLRRSRAVASVATPKAVELGVKFTADVAGYINGHPLLQGRGEHGHARRQPLDASAAPCSPARPSPARAASGWQQVDFDTPSRSAPARPTSRPTTPRTAATRSTSTTSPARTPTRRCARCATACRRQRRLPLQRRPSFPNQTNQASNYWVDVVFDTGSRGRTPRPRRSSSCDRRREHQRGHRGAVTATLQRSARPATIPRRTFELRDARQRSFRRRSPRTRQPTSRAHAGRAPGVYVDRLHRRPSRAGRVACTTAAGTAPDRLHWTFTTWRSSCLPLQPLGQAPHGPDRSSRRPTRRRSRWASSSPRTRTVS